MVFRDLQPVLETRFANYPVVTLTGPRQSGKSTLCRMTFPELPWVNFEPLDTRSFAATDPRGFLARYPDGAIFDEIQRVPELVSYIQDAVDISPDRNSRFILTGSQNLALSHLVTQSLAGRTALLNLLPFSIHETSPYAQTANIDEVLYTGFYPRIYEQKLNPTQMLGDYYETYVERDVRQLLEIRNLTAFQRFIHLCAGRVGQLLNLQNLGAEAGVSHTTAKEWLSVLQATFVVFLLQPFHENISKRLVKTPKLYFYDVGLASYLIGAREPSHLNVHPLRGALFENLVVMEFLKARLHQGLRSDWYFFRDSQGLEVDLLEDLGGNQMRAVEIKAAQTFDVGWMNNIQKLSAILPQKSLKKHVIYAGETKQRIHDVELSNYKDIANLI